MFYLDPKTHRRFTIGTAFSYQGAAYPYTKANHPTFMSLGFKQVRPEPRPNGIFYRVGRVQNDGTWVKSSRDVESVKARLIAEQSQAAHDILKHSDWMVYRAGEGGINVPADWSLYRANVRTACELRQAALQACHAIEALETAYGSLPAWPEAPTD